MYKVRLQAYQQQMVVVSGAIVLTVSRCLDYFDCRRMHRGCHSKASYIRVSLHLAVAYFSMFKYMNMTVT
jgi:hypothetical protein